MTDIAITTGQSVRFGWGSIKKNFWFFVGITFISLVIGSLGSEAKESTTFNVIGFLASAWMTCGTTMIYLQFHRGQKPTISTLFTTIEPYLNVLGATILVCLIVVGGFILLIVPGIYWALKYQFTVPLIVDQKLGVLEAMRRSAEMTKGRKMSLLGFDLTMLGVVILGALALGVGILVSIPVAGLALIDLYQKLVAATPKPQTA